MPDNDELSVDELDVVAGGLGEEEQDASNECTNNAAGCGSGSTNKCTNTVSGCGSSAN